MASNLLLTYLGQGLASARPTGADFGSAEMGWYYATDTSVLSFWDGSAWANISAVAPASASETANFTTASGISHYDVDTTSAAVTVTMNAAPANNEIVEIWDAGGDAGTHAISFNGNGKNIAGSATLSNFININYGHARLRYNGTQWLIA